MEVKVGIVSERAMIDKSDVTDHINKAIGSLYGIIGSSHIQYTVLTCDGLSAMLLSDHEEYILN